MYPPKRASPSSSSSSSTSSSSSSKLLVVLLALLVGCGLLPGSGGSPDDGVYGCPAGCTCSQQSVRCLNLLAVPKLPADSKIIDLRNNRIRKLDRSAFRGLVHVHTIFLNDNQLSFIEPNSFEDMSSLRYLYLNDNRISKLADNAFRGLERLQSLYLQKNDIYELGKEAFSGLAGLKRLHLNNNKIRRLPADSFEHLSTLKSLRMDHNPIHCDCSMLGVSQWLQRLKATDRSVPCQMPRELEGRDLMQLNEVELHCKPPHLTQEPVDVIVPAGESAAFSCRASGQPQPDITWMLNGLQVPANDPRFHRQPDGSLRILNVDASLVGHYECQANNSVGVARSRRARMAIDRLPGGGDGLAVASTSAEGNRFALQKPTIVLRPQGGKVSARHPLVLHCIANGQPEPQISWLLNGRPVGDQSTATVRVYDNGTLVIDQPNVEDSGEYRCEASNYFGSANARVEVTVQVPPIITIPPEHQTLRAGDTITLECEADGFPLPLIAWLRDGRPLLPNTPRVQLEVENTELTIDHIKESDAGQYTCVAENEAGTARVSADVAVQGATGRAPQLLIEPYDMDALPGSTIEMPCQGDGDPQPEVKWKKDGQTVYPTAKHRISASGSLHIKNVEALDGGRYECSVWNKYGRVGDSGVLTVVSNDVNSPGDRFVRIAYAEASREIGTAINQTIANLFGPPTTDASSSSNPQQPRHHGELFKLFRYPSGESLELARAAEIYERTLVNIRKHIDAGDQLTANSSQFAYKDIVSPAHLSLVAELSGCQAHRVVPNCTNMCYHLKYRSIDGTCNNLQHSTWGASLTGFRRVLPPIYENGFSAPIGWNKGQLYHGFPKPSARLISTEVITTKVITQDAQITHMVMQWGQFLDHDLDHAIPSVSSESWDGVDCKKTCDYAAPCYPIEVPPNDPRIKTRRCIDLVRSSAICGSGMTSVFFEGVQPREQINQLTAYVDASQVYGYTTQFSRELRDLSNEEGLLRVGVRFPRQKALLPFAAPTDGIDCRRNLEESTVNCFTAGDIRVNEQIGLAAMHTIWLREHNRVAAELKRLNAHWDGETVYQEARKIVGAQMQHITYAHWLPNVLGARGMELLGKYRGYQPAVNPSISNEFATAALRFGHTLINPLLHRLNETFQPIAQGHLPLHKAFFAPWRLVHEGGVDPLLRGMYSVPAKMKMPTENLNQELTEKLFLTSHAVALDLAAINIQRARDHAIPGYNEYRRVCNLSVAETFEDLSAEISNAEVREKLHKLYGHPGNIDLFVGGILEDPIEGARVGPLFRCLLIEQFRRLRDGDRLWYENAATFRPEQLAQIRAGSLGAVLCNNGDNITRITDDVFHLPGVQGGYKRCEELPQINLAVWLNCDKCAAHGGVNPERPPPFNANLPPSLVTRQRRSVRTKRSLAAKNTTLEVANNSLESGNEMFIEMNDERIEGLESLIDSFEKSLKQMRKRIRKLEESCDGGVPYDNRVQKPARGIHGHCVDVAGEHRINDEIWTQDECTKCECKRRQINCTVEKCAAVAECAGGSKPVKRKGDCCVTCAGTEEQT